MNDNGAGKTEINEALEQMLADFAKAQKAK